MNAFDQKYIACLRGVAIVSIVFGHVGGYWILQPYSSYLHVVGSTFFFFLSGAVLYHIYPFSGSFLKFNVKRFSSLLVPYYFMCLVSLAYCFIANGRLPHFDIMNVFRWLIIAPDNSLMPFPLGQLWFLNLYLLVFLFLPLIVFIVQRKTLMSVYVVFVIFLSLFQCLGSIVDVDEPFIGLIYKVLFYSVFIILGAFIYNKPCLTDKNLLCVMMIFFVVVTVVFAEKNITQSFVNRDIVAISSTIAFSLSLTIFKGSVFRLFFKYSPVQKMLLFFHRNTFSIYLIHTLCILLVEKIFYSVGYVDKTYVYGFVKFLLVLLFSSVLAVPFTHASRKVSDRILTCLS